MRKQSRAAMPAQTRDAREAARERRPRPAKAARGQAAVRLLQDPARRRGAEGAGRAQASRPDDRAVVEQAKERIGKAAQGADEAVADTVAGQGAPSTRRRSAPRLPERFWLQAGSFAGEPTPRTSRRGSRSRAGRRACSRARCRTRATRYRVRLGPYDNTDELNRIKGELAQARLRRRRHQVSERRRATGVRRPEPRRDSTDQRHPAGASSCAPTSKEHESATP